MLPGSRHMGLTTTMRTLFTCWIKERSIGFMVLRVKPSPTLFPTNSLYTTMDNKSLHSIPSVCRPWDVLLYGLLALTTGHRD